MAAGAELYRLESVKQQYGSRVVLDIDHLEIERSETLAVIGPSGSGKSTLLRLLQFLEAPSRGRLVFDGRPMTGAPTLETRRRVTTVFQRPLMLDRSVWDNVAYGQRLRGRRDNEAVRSLIGELGLAPLAQAAARLLSAGEAQRVALARALACDPEVLLLDEPTAGLDPYNVSLVERIIAGRRAAGITIVLVTHLFFQARRLADRTGLLLSGRLVEIGPTPALFESPRDPQTRAFLSGDMVY